MNKLKTWKKVLLILVTIIIFIRVGYIGIRGEVEKQYYTSGTYDLTDVTFVPCTEIIQNFKCEQSRLNSLELIFNDIPDDKKGAVCLAIYAQEELIYQTNLSFANLNNMEWKKIYVNAEMVSGEEYQIRLTVSEECMQTPSVLVVNNNSYAPEIISSYKNAELISGQYAINYGYLCTPNLLERMVMISLWGIIWLLSVLGVVHFERILYGINNVLDYMKKQIKPQILFTVVELMMCFIIVNSSGIEFQEPTKLILYLISLTAIVNYEKKIEYIRIIIDTAWKMVLLIFLYVYGAFALVGQRIWIYPLDMKVTFAGIFVFLCTIIWFIPIIQSAFYYIKVLSCSICAVEEKKLQKWQFVVMMLIFLLIPAAYNLYAFNPGISSPDSLTTMLINAKNIHGMSDWHPPFYSMVLRVILEIWDSTYAVILVQYFFWAYVMTELFLFLREKGMNEKFLLVLSFLCGANAANYLQLNTIWKDVPYTLSLLWVFVICAKLSLDYRTYKGKWYIYLELIIAFTGICLYRRNGIVAFIIVALPLAIILRKNIKVIVSIIASVALVCVITGPVYDYFDIQDAERPGGKYIGLGQDILGVYYAGGEVSEKTLQMINVMTDYNNAEYEYLPTWSYQTYNLDVDITEFVKNYIDTFVKNPVMMIRAVIAREDALWNIYEGQDGYLGCVNYTYTVDNFEGVDEWNAVYGTRKYVSLYEQAVKVSGYTATSQWISAIEWRAGLFTLMGLLAFSYLILIKGKRKHLLIITPVIGQIMSLLLSTGWAEFRYYWPLNLLNLSVVLFTMVITNADEMAEGSNKI